MKKLCLMTAVTMLFIAFGVNAANYPPTLRVPVTFFDFHDDGSNPEFEIAPTNWTVAQKGMVASQLGPDTLPQLGNTPYWNCYIKKWFKPWTPGDFTIPNYGNNHATTDCSGGIITIATDTAFKNWEFDDTLTFTLVAGSNGTYQFSSQNFFPLDGKGPFKNDVDNNTGGLCSGTAHNWSFSMKLHWQFTKVPGLKFAFEGDDDFWAFINNKLVMDLGAIHVAVGDSIALDTMPTLQNNSTYSLDVFYCERHACGSDIKITSNVIAVPAGLSMTVYPPVDTIPAGKNITINAKVVDNNGNIMPDSLTNLNLHWQVDPIPGTSLSSTHGKTVTFSSTIAYKWYNIIGTYTGVPPCTTKIYVKPDRPSHLNLEASADSTQSLNADNRMVFTTFTGTEAVGTIHNNYAILRDEYGNFVSHALPPLTWGSRAPAIATDSGTVNTTRGEGAIQRKALSAAFTFGYATQKVSLQYPARDSFFYAKGDTVAITVFDSVQINISNIGYSRIQISASRNLKDTVSSLTMSTDGPDTTLFAFGLRSDNSGIWDSIQVAWSASSYLKFNRTAPSNATNWQFTPDTAATGKIYITSGTGTNTMKDSINAIFTTGIAKNMGLYPQAGQPNVGTNNAYSSPVYVTAGKPLPIFAKLFSTNEWLKAYETSSAPITWTLSDPNNAGSISLLTGNTTTFTGTKAYQTVTISASFKDATVQQPITATLTVIINPDTAFKLVLEPDSLAKTASPNAARRLDSITITSYAMADSNVYAVIRDRFNNFISYSNPAQWASRNTAIVTAANGSLTAGQGIITRVASTGSTIVAANDASKAFLKDSVKVGLSSAYITSLRIERDSSVVLSGATVNMTVDDDTAFQVYGQWSNAPGTWVKVSSATWSIIPNTDSTTPAPGTSFQWKFMPNFTGVAKVVVSLSGATSDTLTLHVGVGGPSSLVLYSNTGTPVLATKYADPAYPVTDSAGIGFPVVAKLFDRMGNWLSTSPYETPSMGVIWTLTNIGSDNHVTGSITPTSGYRTVFTPTRANDTAWVIATFTQGTIVLKDTVAVKIFPGSPIKLCIEPDLDSTSEAALHSNRSYSYNNLSLTIDGYTLRDSIYGVLRDTFNNYIGRVTALAPWTSRNTAIVTATPRRTALGEGELMRIAVAGGTSFVVCQQGLLKDSVNVIVLPVAYKQIHITNSQNPTATIPNDSINMRTDQSETLYAYGLQADGSGTWDLLNVNWSSTTGLTFNPIPPNGVNTWTFSPTNTGTGLIYIAYTANTLKDSVKVVFNYGIPKTLTLWNKQGFDSTAMSQYHDTTITAGTILNIYAKLRDSSNTFLQAYENNTAPFTWTTNYGSLTGGTGSAGSYRAFTDTKAGDVANITATFSENNITLIKSFKVTIVAGAAAKLVIVADTVTGRLNNAAKIGSLTIPKTDSTKYVYAVLQDAYGNFVTFSNPTTWISNDVSLATATSTSKPALGEGLILRKAKDGYDTVVAKNGAMSDTVYVTLASVDYTAIHIVSNPSDTVTALPLSITTDTSGVTLYVVGKRSDNGKWELATSAWVINSLTGDMGKATGNSAPASANSWKIVPVDTGSGKIVVTNGTQTDNLLIQIKPGRPYSLELFPADGNPANQKAYDPPTIPLTDTAGRVVPVVAKIFDKNNKWLSSFEGTTSSIISWNVIDLPGNTNIPTVANGSYALFGYKTGVKPLLSKNYIYIVATYDSVGIIFSDTMQVRVVAGQPYKLVLEGSQPADHGAAHMDTLNILSSSNSGFIYAVIRDSLNNLVTTALHNTQWTSRDSTVVTAKNYGTNSLYQQGEVDEASVPTSNSAVFVATSLDYPNMKYPADSSVAKLQKYYYIALRITDASGTPIDSLGINTNQFATIKVQGQRSTDAQWEDVSAAWASSAGLRMTPAAPGNAESWTFNPDTAGVGTISVSLADPKTPPDTIKAVFTNGPPTKLDIKVLGDSTKAGDTTIALITISNNHGVMPGDTCLSISLGDSVGSKVISSTDSLQTINPPKDMQVCFVNGVATVKIVSTIVPANGKDVITGILTGVDPANATIHLVPGDLASIRIVDGATGADLSQLDIASNDSRLLQAIGYDAYGNVRGPEIGNWTDTGSIAPITNGTEKSSITYQAGTVVYDESGTIRVVAVGKNGTLVSDSVAVNATGQFVTLVSSATQDTNGNGLLDGVVLKFSKKFTMTDSISNSLAVTVVYNGKTDTLPVSSITSLSGNSYDSVFVVHLQETSLGTPVVGQTGWTPTVTIPAFPQDGNSKITQTVTDGAGPVIMTVLNTQSSTSSHAADVVTVTFSEPIGSNGDAFDKAAYSPSQFLVAWKDSLLPSGRDTLVQDLSVLAGLTITSYTSSSNNITSISFQMTNGQDLTNLDYLSLLGGNAQIISDLTSQTNAPDIVNIKRQVNTAGGPTAVITILPNPTSATTAHVPAGSFSVVNAPAAPSWIQNEKKGTDLQFNIPFSTTNIDTAGSYSPSDQFYIYAKIYDIIGNVVQSNEGQVSINPNGSSSFSYNIYWNGYNEKGMAVASGVYKVLVVLKITNPSTGAVHYVKLVNTIGITHRIPK